MSMYSFLQGYNDEQRHQSDMKTAEISRRSALQEMEFRRQEHPLDMRAKTLRNALDGLNVQYERDTQPLKIDKFKREMEDAIREYKLRADLDPKVRQLANVKADSDIAGMQNSLHEAELSRAVTPEQFNAILSKQGAPYKVQAAEGGKFALIGGDGKQIGDPVSLEQLSYSLQNPQGYNKAAYENLAQLALGQSKHNSGSLVIPPNTTPTNNTPPSANKATLSVPSVLGGTAVSPAPSAAPSSPSQHSPQAQLNPQENAINPAKALTLAAPFTAAFPTATTVKSLIGIGAEALNRTRTAKDIYKSYFNAPQQKIYSTPPSAVSTTLSNRDDAYKALDNFSSATPDEVRDMLRSQGGK